MYGVVGISYFWGKTTYGLNSKEIKMNTAIWQTIEQRIVADYGILEDFVSMVTDIVPQLLTNSQRTQLILGLRAQQILELCQLEENAHFNVMEQHLERMNILVKTSAASGHDDPCSTFVDFVKHLLNNPAERKNFFLVCGLAEAYCSHIWVRGRVQPELVITQPQNVFPKNFGPSYNNALRCLMEHFLSRLQSFLPWKPFQQVASTCADVSSVLGDCLKSIYNSDELRTLLQYHKNHSQPGHSDISSDGTCIMSALMCAALKDHCSQETPDWKSFLHVESKTNKGDELRMEIDETHDTVECDSGEVTNSKGNVESQNNDVSCPQLDSCEEGKTLAGSLQFRPVRRNRGLKMKRILVEEKRELDGEEDLPVNKAFSDEDNGSEYSSWSFYSDEDSQSYQSSWSDSSGDDVSEVTPAISSPKLLNLTLVTNDKSSAATSTKFATSQNKVPPIKSQVKCFICNEQVSINLKTHIRTHFPEGQYTCLQCNTRFKLFSSLTTHLEKCYDYGQQSVDPRPAHLLYKCDHCEKAFRYNQSLEAHKRTHNELYCSVCRKVLKDATTLERHKASHTGFQCTRCEVSFTLFKPLRSHYQHFHKISRPFKCNHCPKTFSRLNCLIRHEWRETGHLPFQCNKCTLRFRGDYDLVSHQRVHTKEKPYLCGDCGKTFSQKHNLRRHQRFLHSESKNEKKYFCTECKTSFKEKGALIQHQRRKHLKQLIHYLCPDCGKTLSASSIARHRLIHTGERPLKCTAPDCNKSFLSATEKKKHILMHHSTERPFKCYTCGKGFVTIGLLNEHSKNHSGKKPFVCDICNKAFPKRNSMIRHKKLVHTSS
ncbi:zinc finger protein 879-like isoform X4 [Syngnathoides biaculeatus]|uniref:zinc finger protein 879-like isoform X4 n=2 Tax=Syngnathoides biaculeatus TaxID=300417 RepID=UPI002ADD8500|nr:zinc finger protein 879-like isoform X4 [Syngnathoides biaculeatus]